jgi:multicomponent Na+:H+ antiporter subunit D
MSWQTTLPLLIVLSAMVSGILILRVKEHANKLRTSLNIFGALLCVTLVVIMLVGVYQGEVFETRFTLLPNMDLVLKADALSLLFVSLSAVLWFFTTIYAIGYLEESANRSRFFGFFGFCVSATMGVALAGNLITFLIFYELLTLVTYPLVMHKGNPASMRAGRTYLIYTMIGGAVLLAGVVWLKSIAGPLDFDATGVLEQMPNISENHLRIIFILLIAGLGVKAALIPLHGWLPVAMAAPAPVSALLHAVAVVKAGVFGIVRVVYDVYGIEFSRELGLTLGLAIIAAATIIYASLRAIAQNDLKKRLAYSTVSQVSYIALGTAIAGPIATIGGIVHLVHQGLMKITMFFCAGNLAETLGINKISDLNGAGRRMPVTMTAFSFAALGMIGLPPAAGFVSKWYLGVGAIEVDAYWIIAVLAISSLLNAIYFLPILYAAWFLPAKSEWPNGESPKAKPKGLFEAHWMLILPPAITASLALLAGVFAGSSLSPLYWTELVAAREYGSDFVLVAQQNAILQPALWWCVFLPLLATTTLTIRWVRQRCLILLPLAAAPVLFASILLEPNGANTLSELFFGSIMSMGASDKIFLILASLVWFAAGLYSVGYMKDKADKVQYCLFFLLAMCGNFGLIFAQDLFGFITFFTLMSLSSYGLVIHTADDAARKAAKTYVQWVIIGEVILFAGLTGLAYSSGAISEAASSTTQAYWVTLFLVAGFGVKLGLIPFHVWLPRAHPAAPVPASALLSGVMVKAGLIGWLRFLPLGDVAISSIGTGLIYLGFSGTFLAALVGLLQKNAKSVLAYSTISQMGIVIAAVGVGLKYPELWPAVLPAIVLFAFHHGIVKATLFLCVDFIPALASRRSLRILAIICLIIPVFAIIGLPFSSGAMAKSALKGSFSELAMLPTLLLLSAVGTSLLMLRFVDILWNSTKNVQNSGLDIWRCLSFALLFFSSVVFIYALPESRLFWVKELSFSTLVLPLLPLILAVLLYLIIRKTRLQHYEIPAGDIVVLIEDVGDRVKLAMHKLSNHNSASDVKKYGLGKTYVKIKAYIINIESESSGPNPGLVLLGFILVVTVVSYLN